MRHLRVPYHIYEQISEENRWVDWKRCELCVIEASHITRSKWRCTTSTLCSWNMLPWNRNRRPRFNKGK